ncbi:MAG: hypothetical protein ED859_14250 [Desulfuromonadales bacterium]|nr:MAG: hypothetical protein ED859_14250 [Desulfuromonadales bacterium]
MNMSKNEATTCNHNVPSPSRLYHLEPIGIGTPFVESYSSYLTRVAHAHLLAAPDLVKHVISPEITDLVTARNKTPNKSYKLSWVVNGLSTSTEVWIEALSNLTLRDDLAWTTLLRFRQVFSERKLLREEKAWCPHCFDRWKNEGLPIYEPLLWMIAQVHACPEHRTFLLCSCPHCGEDMPLHKATKAIGLCRKCGNWLGDDGRFRRDPTDEHLRYATAIGELLAHVPCCKEIALNTSIPHLLDYLVERRTKGSEIGLAKLVRIKQIYIGDWRQGKYLPPLGAVARICRFFNLSLREAVLGEIGGEQQLIRLQMNMDH